jgi:hypothetical protein
VSDGAYIEVIDTTPLGSSTPILVEAPDTAVSMVEVTVVGLQGPSGQDNIFIGPNAKIDLDATGDVGVAFLTGPTADGGRQLTALWIDDGI